MNSKKVKLDRYGRKEMTGHLVGPVFISAIFFVISGRVDLYRAWIWAVLTLVYYVAGMLVVYYINPELLNERGNWQRKSDAKNWDKIMLLVFGTIGLYGHTIVMALDAGRFGWSLIGDWSTGPGILLYTFGFVTVYWAMAVNPHFETRMRIQHDRDHRVVSRGPYRIIRHPGYAGLIISNFASTMIVGSAYGLTTAIATLIIVGTRTFLEDRDLRIELDGYEEYSRRVRYRLIPLIW